jgi:hypothetical protein
MYRLLTGISGDDRHSHGSLERVSANHAAETFDQNRPVTSGRLASN